MRDDAARGLLLVAGATFFWSLSGVFARWLPQVDPWTFNATRGLGMGVSLQLPSVVAASCVGAAYVVAGLMQRKHAVARLCSMAGWCAMEAGAGPYRWRHMAGSLSATRGHRR